MHQFLELRGTLKELFGEDFDCHEGAIALVDALVDFSPGTLSQAFHEVEGFELIAIQLLVLNHSLILTLDN